MHCLILSVCSICFPTDAWCSTYENPFKDLLASLPQVEASLPQEAASQPQEAASLPQEKPATEEQLDLRGKQIVFSHIIKNKKEDICEYCNS